MMQWIRKNALALAWIQAILGLVGSLYFSEVRHFAPCVLCWWQRVAMYPLVIILGILVTQPIPHFQRFVLPFSMIGLGIAIYQNLLYYKIIPEAIAPCTTGVSCTTKYIEYFGFLTIPMMALIGFAIITALALIARPTQQLRSHY